MKWFCATGFAFLAATVLSSCATQTQMAVVGEGYFAPKYEGVEMKPAEPLTRFRDKCRMLLFADEGARVIVHLKNSQVSERYKKDLTFTITAPDGKRVLREKLAAAQARDFSFTASMEGPYELRIDAQHNVAQITVDGARLCIPASESDPCAVIQGSQRLWFYVPSGSKGFEVLLRGQGKDETATAEIFNPEGKTVKRGTTVGTGQALLNVPVSGSEAGAIWSLKICKAEEGIFEDASVALLGNVGPVLAQQPNDLVLPLMRADMAGLYRRSDESKIVVKGAILAPLSAMNHPLISLSVASGETEVFQAMRTDIKGDFEIELPRAKLPAGAYTLKMSLREKESEQDLCTYQREFYMVDCPKNLRADKVTLHRGKPFFARGLYHVNPEDYELVKKQGFNIVQTHPDNVPKCEAAGINAAVALYWGMTVDPKYYREKVSAFRGNPAVVCWMIMDEPDGNKTPLDVIQRGYATIREMDPDRPAYMCLCQPSAYGIYGLATDIIAIDVYPIREGSDDLSSIWKALDTAKAIVPGQTVWFIGQVWSWPGKTDPEKRRLVTAAEHRCMTYLALTHGNVRGLMWFDLHAPDWYLPRNNPEVWAACKQVNDELIALEPVLLDANQWEKTAPGSDGAEIHLAMKEHDGVQYIIAVNPCRKATEATIELDGKGQAEVMFESRKVGVQGGGIKDKFDSLAVHIYKVDNK